MFATVQRPVLQIVEARYTIWWNTICVSINQFREFDFAISRRIVYPSVNTIFVSLIKYFEFYE